MTYNKTILTVLFFTTLSVAQAATPDTFPVKSFSANLANEPAVITNKKLEFSMKKSTLTAKDAGIQVFSKVKDIGKADDMDIKCFNAQVSHIESSPDMKKRWSNLVKVLKEMGIKEVHLNLHRYAKAGGAPEVHAKVMKPNKLHININLFRDKGICQAALPWDLSETVTLAQGFQGQSGAAFTGKAGQKKTVLEVVREWSLVEGNKEVKEAH